jgi:hypothetical protein
MTPIEAIISRLEKVRPGRSGQWSACCPAHKDKSPSLSIRETDEGSVLIYCFSGCSVNSIVESIGLSLSDLFPPREKSGKEPKKTPKLYTPAQALQLFSDYSFLIVLLGIDIIKGNQISEYDLDCCMEAVCKIVNIRYECMGNQF